MNVYLDASPPLRAILRDGPVLSEWAQWDFAITSAMFGVEARRTLELFATHDRQQAIAARVLGFEVIGIEP